MCSVVFYLLGIKYIYMCMHIKFNVVGTENRKVYALRFNSVQTTSLSCQFLIVVFLTFGRNIRSYTCICQIYV